MLQQDDPALNPAAFPRTYKGSKVALITHILSTLTCAALTALLLQGTEGKELFLQASGVIPVSLCGVICVGYAYRTLTMRITLYTTAIEIRGLLHKRRFAIDDLEGLRREENENSPDTLILVPKDYKVGFIKIPAILETDTYFHTWMRRLPSAETRRKRNELD